MAPRGFAAALAATAATCDGGCLCGAVRYRMARVPTDIAHCHCATCRRSSGAPFLTFATLARDEVAVTQGEPRAYASSAEAQRWHCETCGTQLFLDDTREPATIDVTVGSLDQPDAVEPVYNAFSGSRLRWIKGFDASLPDDPDWATGGPEPSEPARRALRPD